MKKHFKRGVTLLELTIVLALLGIITAIIVSFSVLVKNYTLASTTDEVVLTDISKVKMILDTWSSHIDDSNYEVFINSDGELIARNTASDQEYKLLITDDGVFAGSYPTSGDVKKIVYNGTGRVDNITFSIIESTITSNVLIKLTVHYTYYNSTGIEEVEGERVFLRSLRAATYGGE